MSRPSFIRYQITHAFRHLMMVERIRTRYRAQGRRCGAIRSTRMVMKAGRKWMDDVRASALRSGPAIVKYAAAVCAASLFCAMPVPPAQAAQVQPLNTQTGTATGAGGTGTPAIASFNIPSGKNRVLFIWPTFERDHCSNADAAGGLCVNGNIISTGLGDNFPEPRIGTSPSTTSNNQMTARVVGPGGTINKQNALTIGGSPSGDTRFIVSSTLPNDPDPVNPPNVPAGSAFFSLSSFHIVLFENEINTLLGGAASGTGPAWGFPIVRHGVRGFPGASHGLRTGGPSPGRLAGSARRPPA